MKRVVIVGGGFGGIRAALDLARARRGDLEIVLVSDRPHFEYYPALYRVVAGGSALETCIPLGTIFRGWPVKLVTERVSQVDLRRQVIRGQAGYEAHFDYLILALGSETAYFNIPGLADLAYGFKSTYEALALKRHLATELQAAAVPGVTPLEQVKRAHFVLVGAGPSGVELAAELACATRRLARHYGLPAGLVTIDLVEAAPRILPVLPERVAERIRLRLQVLGVNLFVNRAIAREEIDQVYLPDMTLKTKTVIWTAGVKPAALYSQIEGLTFDKKGRVVVNDYLQAPGFPNVFIVGDGAAIKYGGLAQTALAMGRYAARFIGAGRASALPFEAPVPFSSIPVGPGWASTGRGWFQVYGRPGWWLRRFADLRFFWSILPPGKALRAFKYGAKLSRDCPVCAEPQ